MSILPSANYTTLAVSHKPMPARSVAGAAMSAIYWMPLVVATIAIIAIAGHARWSVARDTPWQCDELPLLRRMTGAGAMVQNEMQARQYRPSLYTMRTGAIRSLQAPKHITAIHTTTAFWMNLTTGMFGVTPQAARIMPWVWSMLAAVFAAWGAWLIFPSIPAVCVAALVVTFSPHALLYGTQARGYAEAMALAPLLWIALEMLRRRPQSMVRVLLVLACAVQLALTVYTAWLYWVLPTLLLATWVLPGKLANPQDARLFRTTLVVLCASLVLFMGLFTLERWRSLSFTSGYGGITLDSIHATVHFVVSVVEHLFFLPALVIALLVPGMVVLWRCQQRWWMFGLMLGLTVPAAFALVNGSPGYPRNFGFLVGPLAMLMGVGAGFALSWAQRRWRSGLVASLGTLALLIGPSLCLAGVAQRAKIMLLPDWGSAVLWVESQPETVGPRWFARCLANHWQINWYAKQQDLGRYLDTQPGDSIELVMGTQKGLTGGWVVYQIDPSLIAIAPHEVPTYLMKTPVRQSLFGVEIRSWTGIKMTHAEISKLRHEEPIFLIAVAPSGLSVADTAKRFGKFPEGARDIVSFKPAGMSDGVLETMIVPARLFDKVRAWLIDERGCRIDSVHCFRLANHEMSVNSSMLGNHFVSP